MRSRPTGGRVEEVCRVRAHEHLRVAEVVGPGRAWSAVHHLHETTSTHDDALARLRAGEPVGFVVVADHQSRGRGRAGRGWEDGPTHDASLMLTATASAGGGELTLAPLAAGVAVVDAVDRELGLALQLKWPNDVLIDGRKCVGILVERHRLPASEVAAPPDVLLVGIGVDVDWRGVDRSQPGTWTSLAEEHGADVDRFALLAGLLDALAQRLAEVAADPVGLRATYRRRCVTLGQEVRAQRPDGATIVGRAVDVDAAGSLVVDTPTGRVAVVAGDVHHVRPTA